MTLLRSDQFNCCLGSKRTVPEIIKSSNWWYFYQHSQCFVKTGVIDLFKEVICCRYILLLQTRLNLAGIIKLDLCTRAESKQNSCNLENMKLLHTSYEMTM